MPDYLILRRDDSKTPPWVTTQIVTDVDTAAELREVVKQGFIADGEYAVCRWDNHRGFDLRRRDVPDVTDL